MLEMPIELMSFLQWIVAGGGTIAASWILESVPWYQEKEPVAKKWIFFGIAAVITILSYVIFNYVPQDILTAIAPYFGIVAGIWYTTFIGTAMHRVSKPADKIEFIEAEYDTEDNAVG